MLKNLLHNMFSNILNRAEVALDRHEAKHRKRTPIWPTKLDIEIGRVQAALVRYNDRIEAMNREWARSGGICCPNCMFGDEYTNLADKIERVEHWLGILKSRKPRARAA